MTTTTTPSPTLGRTLERLYQARRARRIRASKRLVRPLLLETRNLQPK